LSCPLSKLERFTLVFTDASFLEKKFEAADSELGSEIKFQLYKINANKKINSPAFTTT